MSAEADLALHIATTLGGPYVYGSNVREGPVRKPSDDAVPGAVPHACVFCISTGGLDDIPFADGGAKTAEKRFTVQIWVRSEPLAYDDGATLAQAVFDAVDKTPPAGYFEARALASQPAYVRMDDTDHHEWSINVLLRRSVGV